MHHIKTFNTIAHEGLKLFEENYHLNESVDPDALLLRSHSLQDYDFNPRLKAIARAGVGVNNIPVGRCSEHGVVVFNTPGANANAVKELVLASLILSIRPIIQGSNWLKTLSSDHLENDVEAHKKMFIGGELEGKTLGVIGLGNIGAQVANDAYRLGMNVMGYDPYVSVNTAWNISRRVHRALSLDEVLINADFVSLHVPLLDNTKHLIGTSQLSKMKKEAVLLNFSRGELVDTEAVIHALDTHNLRQYITDFATKELVKHEQVIVFPHLGASTKEAEINCAKAAVKNLMYFLETGNIVNSVNFPNIEMTLTSPTRFTIIHRNIPNMLAHISSVAGNHMINIDNMLNRNSGDYAYTLVDIQETNPTLLAELQHDFNQIESVIKTRIIRKI